MVTIGPFIDTYSQASWGVTRAQTNYFRQTNFALVCKELESLLQNIWEGYIKLSTMIESLLKNLQQTFNHAYTSLMQTFKQTF